MKQVVLKINGLNTVGFDPIKFISRMSLNYEVSGQKKSALINVGLMQKSDAIVESILNFVMSQGRQDVDERDDILDQVYSKNLVNEDKTEERLYNYFAKLCEKAKFMKANKNHVDHMKMYQEIKGSRQTMRAVVCASLLLQKTGPQKEPARVPPLIGVKHNCEAIHAISARAQFRADR